MGNNPSRLDGRAASMPDRYETDEFIAFVSARSLTDPDSWNAHKRSGPKSTRRTSTAVDSESFKSVDSKPKKMGRRKPKRKGCCTFK